MPQSPQNPDDWFPDAEPPEETPESKEEDWQSIKDLGVKPKNLRDPKDRAEYAAWLEAHENDCN